MEKLELKKELEVKKSEQLVYGKYKLSATAQKLVTTVVSLVQKEDEYNKEYCILAKDFIELSGTKTNDREALKNATLFFQINEKETDIILKHMWPLTVKPPRYKEAFIVCLLDKFCCLVETLKIHSLLSPYHV